MKISKQFLLAGAMLCAITTTGAHAVTKCATLSSRATCTSSSSQQYEYRTDWAATCTTNGRSTPISGIAICSSTKGGMAATATELDISSTVDENKYCWCKMTSPAVSRWVSAGGGSSASGCAQVCASSCAMAPQYYPIFKSVLFGSLSD